MDKDTKKILAEAERQGFTWRLTSKGHAEVRNAEGLRVATFSGSTGDVRGYRNALAKLRQAGFVWPPRKR